MALVIAWMLQMTPEGVRVEHATGGGKGLYAIAGGLAVLAIAWYFLGQPSYRSAAEAPATAGGPPSVAVLPFANLSDDREAGVLLRRHDRGAAQRAGEDPDAQGRRAHLGVRVQGQGRRRARDRRQARGEPHRRGQHPPRGRAGAGHRAADPRGRWLPRLVRDLRPRTQGRVRAAGRDRRAHRRAVADFARRGRGAHGARADHRPRPTTTTSRAARSTASGNR